MWGSSERRLPIPFCLISTGLLFNSLSFSHFFEALSSPPCPSAACGPRHWSVGKVWRNAVSFVEKIVSHSCCYWPDVMRYTSIPGVCVCVCVTQRHHLAPWNLHICTLTNIKLDSSKQYQVDYSVHCPAEISGIRFITYVFIIISCVMRIAGNRSHSLPRCVL